MPSLTALPTSSPNLYADLPALAKHLRTELQGKKFALIYAHNGTGKTRLCGEFKGLGKRRAADGTVPVGDTLYFNAFTEDLFNWDNDLEEDQHRVLKLNVNSQFFRGLATMEIDNRIRPFLDRYADFDFRLDTEVDKDGRLTKAEVVFFRDEEKPKDDNGKENAEAPEHDDPFGIKISRGEESIFIWCFFLAILQLALDGADDYKWVQYVYIDDPITSLDEHNAVVVGNHLVELYKGAKRQLSTVVSTHHALFFNVLHYEVKNHLTKDPHKFTLTQHLLKRDKHSGGYRFDNQKGDTPQFYHVSALADLWAAAEDESVSTYHFNVLRTILEKTAFFHGYGHFASCIKKDADDAEGILHQRFVDILSHGKYSMYEPVEMGEQTREYFKAILNGFLQRHPFNPALFSRAAAFTAVPSATMPGTAATALPAPSAAGADADAASVATPTIPPTEAKTKPAKP